MPGQKLTDFYDRISDRYDLIMNMSGYTLISRLLINTIPTHFKSPVVLDMGCGTGITSGLIRKRFTDAGITGLDNSKKMLEIYSKKFPGNQTLLGDFNRNNGFRTYPEDIPVILPSMSFDIVISAGAVLEYGILEKAFSLIYRLLKTDGMAVIIGTKKNIFTDMLGNIYWKYKLPRSRDVNTLLTKIGFSHVSNNSNHTYFPISLFKEIIIAWK